MKQTTKQYIFKGNTLVLQCNYEQGISFYGYHSPFVPDLDNESIVAVFRVTWK
ncbi:hypothetical protein [Niabella terrae]